MADREAFHLPIKFSVTLWRQAPNPRVHGESTNTQNKTNNPPNIITPLEH